jgi:hypothetical protein
MRVDLHIIKLFKLNTIETYFSKTKLYQIEKQIMTIKNTINGLEGSRVVKVFVSLHREPWLEPLLGENNAPLKFKTNSG